MKIQFFGAATGVTGSCHLVTTEKHKILLDCGQFQGGKTREAMNYEPFPFDPAEIDYMILSHAHIDHCGRIPLLVKRGFKGDIYCTDATADLVEVMLKDSGYIHEKEAEWKNRKNERAGRPAVEPLYTFNDAVDSLKFIKPVLYDQLIELNEEMKFVFNDAGHILGSAITEIWITEEGQTSKIVFSGDIGREERPIICDPEQVKGADYLVIEGTYGDRNHQESTAEAKEAHLISVLKMGIARGGNIVIPSFAVGRTQELLYYIKRLLMKNAVPGLENVPVYIDSPLGINATKVYEKCAEGYYDEEARAMAKSGSPFDFPNLRVAVTADESKLINAETGCNIIISSSGMCDAGRIRHHLKHNLYRADSTVIFTGYQAEGTLGRMLLDGAKKVRLFGEDVRVNATIERIEGFSGHAGRDELIEWIEGIGNKPVCTFFVHGESDVLDGFSSAVASLGYHVEVPELLEEFTLLPGSMERTQESAPASAAEERVEAHYAVQLHAQLERLSALLEHTDWKADASAALRAEIMEEDIRALVDKWERILRRG